MAEIMASQPQRELAQYRHQRSDGPLESRDGFDVDGPHIPSDHFQFIYGHSGNFDGSLVVPALEALEVAWQAMVEEMGHTRPWGTDTYFLNVYVGNSGDNAPTIDFGGAYATLDGEGFPIIVVHPDVLEAYRWGEPYDQGADDTMAHEFYHTIQNTLNTWPYAGMTGWYWEATAEWSARHVFPEHTNSGWAVGAFALLPHYSLYHFDYPDDGTLVESHHYGAQVFPLFLSDDVADSDLIRDSWMDGHGSATPLDWLDEGLEEWGTDLDSTFADFVARTTTWDMTRGEMYEQAVMAYQSWYPEEDHRFAYVVPYSGTDGWVEAPEETLPRSWGFNLVKLPFPLEGELTVGFEGDESGRWGSRARWSVTVVKYRIRSASYIPLELEENAGELVFDIDEEAAIYLAIAPQPSRKIANETFGYSFQMRLEPPEEPVVEEEEPIRACGCGTTGKGAGGVGVLIVGVLMGWRRRGE
jgi:MYXO-CTERM domain-containing protein